MSIADKLNYLLETKRLIRAALEGIGVEVSDTDTLRGYAGKIADAKVKPQSLTNFFLNSTLSDGEINRQLQRIDFANITALGGTFQGCLIQSVKVAVNKKFYSCPNVFRNCIHLTSIPDWDWSKNTNYEGAFYGCTGLPESEFGKLSFASATHLSNAFANCTQMTEMTLTGGNFASGKILGFSNVFQGCSGLERLDMSDLDPAGFPSFDHWLSGTSVKWARINNIGKRSAAVLQRFECPWGDGGDENRETVLWSLRDHSFDRAAAKYGAFTLYLSETTKGLLTEDEIAAITAKGFTIA